MATYPTVASTRRAMPLWLALAIGAAVLLLAILADALDVRPAPVVGSHLDRPYLPTQHLTQDLAR
ncbi:MAG TPA: hypothetical protein VNO86_12360 [Candidatus Binatia bacterium]|nr:hypothetical protein [Candidatus Binatia bacterium]